MAISYNSAKGGLCVFQTNGNNGVQPATLLTPKSRLLLDCAAVRTSKTTVPSVTPQEISALRKEGFSWKFPIFIVFGQAGYAAILQPDLT